MKKLLTTYRKSQNRSLRTATLQLCLLLTVYCSITFADVKIQGNPATYATIQAAVNAAVNGDKLLVSTGLYLETVVINGKSIELEGGYLLPGFSSRTNDLNTTIIGTNFLNSIIVVSNACSVTLNTLEVKGGHASLVANGGGIAIGNNCTGTIINCGIYQNIAWFGGGISAWSNAVLNVEHSKIIENVAYIGGGGVAGFEDSQITLSGSNSWCFYNYSSAGGGIASSGKNLTLRNGVIVFYNLANKKGGGIYLGNGVKCDIYGENTSVGYPGFLGNYVTNGVGGGIYALDSDIIVSGENCRVAGNYANDSGGGIYLENSSLKLLDKAEIGNSAGANINYAVTNGGCVYMTKSDFMASGSSKVYSGYAGEYGGGIYAKFSNINFSDNSMLGNTNSTLGNYARAGGGLVAINSTTIFDNASVVGNFASGSGGGIYIGGTNVFRFVNSALNKNTAKIFAGGFASEILYSGEILFDNSQIISNRADDAAAAIYANKSAMGFKNCDISYNFASNSIGGIYFISGDLNLENCEVSYNRTEGNIGGIVFGMGHFNCLNNSFRNNSANQNTNIITLNAGALVLVNAIATIKSENGNSLFSGNSASDAAGIYVQNSTVDIITAPPASCLFEDNIANGYGGAIFIRANSKVGIYGNVGIYRNHAGYGGGIAVLNGCNLSIFPTNNVGASFVQNISYTNGAALYIADTGSTAEFVNVLFKGNIAKEWFKAPFWFGGGGGAAVMDHAKLKTLNCVFKENISSNNSNEGGAGILVDNAVIEINGNEARDGFLPASQFINNYCGDSAPGGAICLNNGSYAFISGTIFASNTAVNGGAVLVSDSKCEIENSVIAHNSADNDGSGVLLVGLVKSPELLIQNCDIVHNYQSGLSLWNGTATVYNSILWGNQNQISLIGSSFATTMYCDVEIGYPGVSNINLNPLFDNSANLNYQLTEASPCRDIGMVIPAITNDCIGEIRPYGAGYDIGAYEFIPEPFYLSFIIYYLLIINRKFLFNFSKKN